MIFKKEIKMKESNENSLIIDDMNIQNKFPNDFYFEATDDELENLRSKFLTSSWGVINYLIINIFKHNFFIISHYQKLHL